MLFPGFFPRTSPFSYFHYLLPEILLFPIALNNSPGSYSPGSSQGHPPFPIPMIFSLRYYCFLFPVIFAQDAIPWDSSLGHHPFPIPMISSLRYYCFLLLLIFAQDAIPWDSSLGHHPFPIPMISFLRYHCFLLHLIFPKDAIPWDSSLGHHPFSLPINSSLGCYCFLLSKYGLTSPQQHWYFHLWQIPGAALEL